jgi:hypothetical protein
MLTLGLQHNTTETADETKEQNSNEQADSHNLRHRHRYTHKAGSALVELKKKLRHSRLVAGPQAFEKLDRPDVLRLDRPS